MQFYTMLLLMMKVIQHQEILAKRQHQVILANKSKKNGLCFLHTQFVTKKSLSSKKVPTACVNLSKTMKIRFLETEIRYIKT